MVRKFPTGKQAEFDEDEKTFYFPVFHLRQRAAAGVVIMSAKANDSTSYIPAAGEISSVGKKEKNVRYYHKRASRVGIGHIFERIRDSQLPNKR